MNDESQNDEPLNLEALRPGIDAARFDAIVGTIVQDAMAARSNRAPHGIARELLAWARPALLAAAIVLAIALPAVALTSSYRRASVARATPLPATDALGIPRQLAVILHSSRDPSLAELHDAVLPDVP